MRTPPQSRIAPAMPGSAPVSLRAGASVRADARRLIDAFHAMLLTTNSATAMLERWCAAQGLSDGGPVTATVMQRAAVTTGPAQRARLELMADEPVAYRRVALRCGDHILSEAQNWYVPARLTAAIRAALEGDTPFGTLIEPLHPVRKTFASEVLWDPGANADAPSLVPHAIVRHSALVLDASGRPLAEVAETYTNAILASLTVR